MKVKVIETIGEAESMIRCGIKQAKGVGWIQITRKVSVVSSGLLLGLWLFLAGAFDASAMNFVDLDSQPADLAGCAVAIGNGDTCRFAPVQFVAVQGAIGNVALMTVLVAPQAAEGINPAHFQYLFILHNILHEINEVKLQLSDAAIAQIIPDPVAGVGFESDPTEMLLRDQDKTGATEVGPASNPLLGPRIDGNFFITNFDDLVPGTRSVALSIWSLGDPGGDNSLVLGTQSVNFLAFNFVVSPGETMELVAQIPAVPEPATLLLVGIGLLGFGAFHRRRIIDNKSSRS